MKTINLSQLNSFNCHIKGQLVLDIYTTTGMPYIEADIDEDFQSILIDENNIYFNNTKNITPDDFKRVKDIKKENESALSIISKIAMDLVDIVQHNKNNKDEGKLKAKLYITENSTLIMDGDSLTLNLHNTYLSSMNINCANLNITGNYTTPVLKIMSSNMTADLLFSPENNNLNIICNNGHLNLTIPSNFDGKLISKGTNLKVTPTNIQMSLSNASTGLCDCSFNNGKIVLIRNS